MHPLWRDGDEGSASMSETYTRYTVVMIESFKRGGGRAFKITGGDPAFLAEVAEREFMGDDVVYGDVILSVDGRVQQHWNREDREADAQASGRYLDDGRTLDYEYPVWDFRNRRHPVGTDGGAE